MLLRNLLSCCLVLSTSTLSIASAANALATPGPDAEASWVTWRGNDGTAVSPDGNPPTEWSEEKNVRWKADIPGQGSSSPVIWKDRLYITTAVETDQAGDSDDGSQPMPMMQGRRGGGRRGQPAPTKIHDFVVLCYDRKSGEMVWDTVVKSVVPHEAGHSTATQAAGSPITDGKFIYAYFGSRGMHCLDMEGEIVWSKDLGQMQTRNGFGEGGTPALYGDALVIPWDHEGQSFIVALAKKDGEELWRTERDERTSWATPVVVEVDGKAQAILPATNNSVAYDLKTGKPIWTCTGMTGNCIPTPIYSNGLVYLMSGYRGAALQAIRLEGAKGDLTDSEQVVWSHGRNTSYTPSALLYGDYLYFVSTNSGTLSCLNSKTGEVHYERERLDDIRSVYSSPVGAADRVYLTSREGMTKVIAVGEELKVLASNQLDDTFDASAAIVGDELYLRGLDSLYCIAKGK